MSLQRLVTCPCGHSLEDHGVAGCTANARGRGCRCGQSPTSVIDILVDMEREASRLQWQPAKPLS